MASGGGGRLYGGGIKLQKHNRLFLEFSSTLEECRRQEERLSVELERGRQRGEEVTQDLSQVLEELRNARLDSHESRRQLQRKELLEKLCRLYPDAVVRAEAGGGAMRPTSPPRPFTAHVWVLVRAPV